MKVLFTKRAERNYLALKKYLTLEWGENVARAFEQKTIDFLELIEKYPEMGIVEVAEKQIRSFLITKHTRVFYRAKGNQLVVLTCLTPGEILKKDRGISTLISIAA